MGDTLQYLNKFISYLVRYDMLSSTFLQQGGRMEKACVSSDDKLERLQTDEYKA